MRVVLLANLDMSAGLVNGSQGEIVGFEPYGETRAPRSPSGAHAGYRQEQIEQFMRKSRDREWPVVVFTNGRRCAIYAECSVSTWGDEEPFSLLSRTQIPLMAGWAVTIHKSQVCLHSLPVANCTLCLSASVAIVADADTQGMTLSKVKVDLEKNFEQGMGYVACKYSVSCHQ
jgi:ATP-dependent DNA helicase PIF1